MSRNFSSELFLRAARFVELSSVAPRSWLGAYLLVAMGSALGCSLLGCNLIDSRTLSLQGSDAKKALSGLQVSATVESDTTWKRSAVDVLGCDVTVTDAVQVRAQLTIEPGTRVCFGEGAGLTVYPNASLNATGTEDKHIVFQGTSSTIGFWTSIAFLSLNDDNRMIYTDVQGGGSSAGPCCGFFYGGEDTHAAIIVGDYQSSASVLIQNTTVENSANFGLFAFPGAHLAGFSTNTFRGNGKAGVVTSMGAVGSLDAATDYLGDPANGDPWIRLLLAGDLTDPLTVHNLGLPYGVSYGFPGSVLGISSRVDIEPGVQLSFETNSGWLVDATGELHAAGTPASRVVFTGRQPSKGFWKGLAFLSVGNELTSTDISYGGAPAAFCCGFFDDAGDAHANLVVGDYQTTAGLTLTDVTSTASGGEGLQVIHSGRVSLNGTNDLATGNTKPNTGL